MVPIAAENPLEANLTERVGELLRATPGVDTLAALLLVDPFLLAQPARIDYLAALERQTSWLQAAMQRAIVAVAGEEPSQTEDIWGGVDDAGREDVAAALRLSGSSAQMRIDVARTLVNHLPNTCSALASGEISPAHATTIARETASAIRDGLSLRLQFTRSKRKPLPLPSFTLQRRSRIKSDLLWQRSLQKNLKIVSREPEIPVESPVIAKAMDSPQSWRYFPQRMHRLSCRRLRVLSYRARKTIEAWT